MDVNQGHDDENAENRAEDGASSQISVQRSSGVLIGAGTQINHFYGPQTWTARPAQPPRGDSPYRGLNAFEAEDSDYFFGRDEAVDAVIGRMSARLDAPGMLAVSGASGAGKSSLLRAGVLPRLRRDGLAADADAASWPCLLFTPGPAPLNELAAQVATLSRVDAGLVQRQLAARPEDFALSARQAALSQLEGRAGTRAGRLILLIDQFEQVFTACPDEGQRRAFIAALHAAATGGHGPDQVPSALIVLGVREDFEGRSAQYLELEPVIQDRYRLTAMTSRQLVLAITGPAEKADSGVDPNLTEQLLREISARPAATGTGSATGPGVLPLLSHALDQAWRQRIGSTLTLADYERTGGIEAAVARSAEDAYTTLTPEQQEIAQLAFMSLIAISSEGTDTAVPVTRASLGESTKDMGAGDLEAVLDAFADRRLLTLAADSVEITHEVLLTAWPRLRDNWLQEDRTDRIALTGLRAAAAEWLSQDRDAAYLYTGSRLETADMVATRVSSGPTRFPALTSGERDFLTASLRARQRRTRYLQGAVALLAALAVGLAGTAAFAFVQRAAVIGERNKAVSEVLTQESQATGDSDPALARLQAVAASRLDNSNPNARYAMLRSAGIPWIADLKTTDSSRSYSPAFSADGKILAAITSSGTELWNTTTDRPITTLRTDDGGIALSPDGKLLAATQDPNSANTADPRVQLWDTTTRKPVAILPTDEGTEVSLAFSPDGKFLAVGRGNSIRLWDISNRKPAASRTDISYFGDGDIYTVAFSPDGKFLAAGGDTDVRIWDTATRRLTSNISADGIRDSVISSLAFSPDGTMLAAGGGQVPPGSTAASEGKTWLWNLKTPGQPATVTSADSATGNSVAFGPDSRYLTVATDKSVRLWDTATHDQSAAFPVGAPVYSVAVNRDGILAVGTGNGVRLADLSVEASNSFPLATFPVTKGEQASSIAFSPGGKLLAVASDHFSDQTPGHTPNKESLAPNGTIQLWNTATRAQGIIRTNSDTTVTSVAFSPDGALLAAGTDTLNLNGAKLSDTGSIRLWSTSTRTLIAAFPANAGVESVAFSPDGTLLAAGTVGTTGTGSIQLWSTSTHKPVTTFRANTSVYGVAFSPDGRLLAGPADDDHGNPAIRVWDTNTHKLVKSFPAAGDDGYSVTFSSDGEFLAAGVGARDGTSVQVWNVKTRQQVINNISGSYVSFSPDGPVLAVESGKAVDRAKTVELWDVETDQEIGAIPTMGGSAAGVPDGPLHFISHGPALAMPVNGGTGIQVWNTPYLMNTDSYLCKLARHHFPPDEWKQDAPGAPYMQTC